MITAAGDTFFPTKPLRGKQHLFVVLSEVTEEHPVVSVAVSSQQAAKEQACVLAAHDHPFLTHESVVFYADALCFPLAAYRKLFMDEVLESREAVSPEVLKRIRDGAAASDLLPNEAKIALSAQGVI